MESTQSKTTTRMSANTFLALWIGTYVLVYLLLYAIDNIYWAIITSLPNETFMRMVALQEDWNLIGFLLMALLFGTILSLMQPFLIHRHLGMRLPRWFMMSMAGWLVGGVFAYYAESVRYPAFTFDGFLLSMIALWLPAVLIQMTLLRRATKQWWLWTASNLVAIILFALTYWGIDALRVLVLLQPIGFVPAAIIQGAINAGAFFQMFPQAE